MGPWMLLGAIAGGVMLLMLVLVVSPKHTYWGWKLRHVPGPRVHFLLGNLPDILRSGTAPLFIKLKAIYGPVFKVFVGRHPIVVVTDPDLIRYVGFKSNNRVPPFNILRGTHRDLTELDLLFAKDELWRTLRKAWQPAFSSSSLTGYLQLMDQSAQRLAGILLGRCGGNGGEAAGERLDIHWELGRMTLQVVGTCAYGVDFHALDDSISSRGDVAVKPAGGASAAPPGLVLTKACSVIFESASLQRGSKWSRASVLLPALTPVISWLAHIFPDAPFRRQLQAREEMLRTVRDLIHSSTKQLAATPPVTSPTTSPAKQQRAVSGPGAAVVVARSDSAAGGSSGVPGVEPGSFLGLMLAARNKQTGEALTDIQIMAQAQTFILAGYETTANALAFTIYLVSKHPEVQERLLAEVDSVVASVGGPDAPMSQQALEKCEYITAVFNEALRLFPPAHVTTRHAKEPLTVGKITLPPDSRVFLSIFAIHHDASTWPQPEEFRPERFLTADPQQLNSHLPFGTGARMCIGQKFALLEAKVALVRLYSRLTFELEAGQDPLPTAYGITLSPRNGIWVRPRVRY